ncbi:hypothetical protein SAMN05443572_101657 [Myxococcus fulvus]|uniref:Uncharacterized protein n=1 Tax=Myxococcus fulvus TaxID=33 RepID=A0A511SV56_MYXFU|nr:hypothetical protein [Myxococcus fulvus]GEN05795.1 hypothetical protein MFU01_08320 [Myxococcus fulvus]SES94797.1 hypothetical protein SAMN05443572_101657 [Myxococcus fulvus]
MNQHPFHVFAMLGLATSLTACGGPESPSPAPASEDPGSSEQRLSLVACPLGATANQYSPPLSVFPRDTRITGTSSFTNCVSPSDPEVTSGELLIDVQRPAYSCRDLLELGSTRAEVKWNTGETSTLFQTRASLQLSNTTIAITYTGTVESGKFQGATAVRTLTYVDVDLFECFSSRGIPGMSGVTTLTLLGLP